MQIRKVLPATDYPIVDLPLSHPMLTTQFIVREVPQIPNIGYFMRSGGDTSEQGADSTTPHARIISRHDRTRDGPDDAQHRHRRLVGTRGRRPDVLLHDSVFPDTRSASTSCSTRSRTDCRRSISNGVAKPAQYFRAGAGAMIVNDEGHVLAIERADIAGAWQLPQGGLDEDEEPLDAAYREIAEETGIEKADLEVREGLLRAARLRAAVGGAQQEDRPRTGAVLVSLPLSRDIREPETRRTASLADGGGCRFGESIDGVTSFRKPMYSAARAGVRRLSRIAKSSVEALTALLPASASARASS